jgi:rRNA-processing protein FCF1
METHRIRNNEIDMPVTQKRKRPVGVILDSNTFFDSLQFRIDIFEELEKELQTEYVPIVLSPIVKEIEKLAIKGSTKRRKNAAFALSLAEKCTVVNVDPECSASVDDVIVKVAKECGYAVFTDDRDLRRRLRDINVPVIYVRQKSYLEINGRL